MSIEYMRLYATVHIPKKVPEDIDDGTTRR